MSYNFFTLAKIKNYPFIEGVKVCPLTTHRDSRGILVETLNQRWLKVFNKQKLPFAQTYFSLTYPNVARDEDRWHYHPYKQVDRFVVIQGEVIFALYDWRQKSKTYGLLNLFRMGEINKDEGYYLLLIPVNVLHCFLVISQRPAILLNYPTSTYDPKEEGRLFFDQLKIKGKDYFSWQPFRALFTHKKKIFKLNR